MHDDLIDMVEWAVDEGIAQKDKDRDLRHVLMAAWLRLSAATFTPDVFAGRSPWSYFNLSNPAGVHAALLGRLRGYMYRSYGDPRTEEGAIAR